MQDRKSEEKVGKAMTELKRPSCPSARISRLLSHWGFDDLVHCYVLTVHVQDLMTNGKKRNREVGRERKKERRGGQGRGSMGHLNLNM